MGVREEMSSISCYTTPVGYYFLHPSNSKTQFTITVTGLDPEVV